jgi:hypothetical protein
MGIEENIYYTYSACSAIDYAPLKSIWAFSDTSIVVTTGAGVWWFDGSTFKTDCSIRPLLTGAINKLWGSSSSDLYAVGNAGNIAHWNGVKWTKIESGTTIDLKFITGTDNNIFVSGYNLDQSASLLLRLINNQPIVVWSNNNTTGTEPYGNIIYSIRVIRNKLFVSSNTGTYLETIGSSLPPKFLYYNPYRVYQITGTEINDIYTVGSRANINHYNGISKKEIYIDLTSISPFYCADSKLNIVAAGGTKVENVIFHKAIIIIGKRL